MLRTRNTQAPLMSPMLAEDKLSEDDELFASVGINVGLDAVGIDVGLGTNADVGIGTGTGTGVVVRNLVGAGEGLRVKTCCVTDATVRPEMPSALPAAASKAFPVRVDWISLEYASDDTKPVVESETTTEKDTVQV